MRNLQAERCIPDWSPVVAWNTSFRRVPSLDLWPSFGGVIPKPGALRPGEGSRGGIPGRSPVCARDPSLRLKNGCGQDDAGRK